MASWLSSMFGGGVGTGGPSLEGGKAYQSGFTTLSGGSKVGAMAEAQGKANRKAIETAMKKKNKKQPSILEFLGGKTTGQ